MELHPDPVFSKPKFTALPPYPFSGADFALIPSCGEQFGLVAVELGRKGALGVGPRPSGLGPVPVWVSDASDGRIGFLIELTRFLHAVHCEANGTYVVPTRSRTIKTVLKSTEHKRQSQCTRSVV